MQIIITKDSVPVDYIDIPQVRFLIKIAVISIILNGVNL